MAPPAVPEVHSYAALQRAINSVVQHIFKNPVREMI